MEEDTFFDDTNILFLGSLEARAQEQLTLGSELGEAANQYRNGILALLGMSS